MEPFSEIFDDQEIEIICAEAFEEAKANVQKHREYVEKVNKENKFTPYSFNEIKKIFPSVYKNNEGVNFKWTNQNTENMKQLCYYFSNDDRFDGDLNRGLILQGPIGCGKTSVLKAFQLIGCKGFGIVTCKALESLYDVDGVNSVPKYTEVSKDPFGRQNGWLFDDLGWESKGKHFGKEKNVMEDVLELINTKGNWGNMHITTNYSSQLIGEKYGSRIRSRMRMMFNQIIFDPDSKDMRE